MAKSKQQKQQEALDRKRGFFSTYWSRLTRYRPGGVYYKDHLARWGEAEAKKQLASEELKFKAYLKEAQLDTHGNPVEVVKNTSKSKTTPGYSLNNYLEDSRWDNMYHD